MYWHGRRNSINFEGKTGSSSWICVNSMGDILAGTRVVICRHVDVAVWEEHTRLLFLPSYTWENQGLESLRHWCKGHFLKWKPGGHQFLMHHWAAEFTNPGATPRGLLFGWENPCSLLLKPFSAAVSVPVAGSIILPITGFPDLCSNIGPLDILCISQLALLLGTNPNPKSGEGWLDPKTLIILLGRISRAQGPQPIS